jgi:cyclic-di-AMP phosphodiesterase PgpH
MIKQTSKNKIYFLFWGLVVFLINYILQVNLIVSLLLIFSYVYLKSRGISLGKFHPRQLVVLYLIIFLIEYTVTLHSWPLYFIPFSLIPMLAVVLFDNLEIALLISLASSLTLAAIPGSNIHIGLLSLISGMAASIKSKGVRKRSTIIRAGIFVGLLQSLMIIFLEGYSSANTGNYLMFFLNGIASSIVFLGVLPLFEFVFKKTTNISLLELADFNQPLLQQLILEAPGTYHHSLVVGNLSEAACLAVGANSLLARIGAYYHDIGKLAKPTYFSENQDWTESKHDALSPTMSKLIIMNHVKEGIELAKKYKLSPALTDFIQQHHGSSLVYYFYRRALEGLEEDQEVKEEGFRYPGPKPDSKETAIVLLADSVEAATRAMKDPTPAKIEELVHKVVNNKFIDGQLDECELALKDLEKISAVFIRILSGIYHSRVTYPEEQRSENNHKKLPKEDSHQSEKDKKNSS